VQLYRGPIFIRAKTLPSAWETSIAELWSNGIIIETEYDQKSIDSPVVILVEEPLSEPRIHLKGIMAGSPKGLFEYVDEVIEGIHDHLVEKFGYTYHERLFTYKTPCGEIVNQIEYIIEKLRKAPYSRRAQAITWQPWKDIKTEYPPCLQRLWFRVVNGRLILHAHMRSLDYKEPVLIYHDGEVELVPIGEVYEEGLWRNSLAPSVGEDLKIKWMPITNCIKHELERDERIYEVVLLSGRRIRLTKDHALYTYRRGKIVPVPTIELKKGDLILIPRRIPRPAEPVKIINIPSLILKSKAIHRSNRSYLRIINVNRDEIKKLKSVLYDIYAKLYKMKNIRSAVWNAINYEYVPIELWKEVQNNARVRVAFFSKHNTIPVSIPLDEDFGYIVGLWIADGSIRGGRKPFNKKRKVFGIQFSIGRDEEYILSRVKKFFSKIGVNIYVNKAKIKDSEVIIEVPSKPIEFLFRILGLEAYSPKRRVPKIAFNATDEFIEGMLHGHYNGDKHCSTSLELVSDLQYLCLLLGKVTLAYIYEKTRKVTFPDGREAVVSSYGRIYSIIPEGKVPSMVGKHGTRALVKLSLNSDITFDVVKEIREVEPTCNYVYDLSVPPYENFIGGYGGIVVHNSNDALKAAFMNMYAFTELQRRIAKQLGVEVGYYMHIADSYHIYESDWKWAEKFVEQIRKGTSRKYWRTTGEFEKIAKISRRKQD